MEPLEPDAGTVARLKVSCARLALGKVCQHQHHVHQHEKEFQKLQKQISGDKRQFPMIKSFADITSVNNKKTPSSSDLQRFNSSPSSNFLTIR